MFHYHRVCNITSAIKFSNLGSISDRWMETIKGIIYIYGESTGITLNGITHRDNKKPNH